MLGEFAVLETRSHLLLQVGKTIHSFSAAKKDILNVRNPTVNKTETPDFWELPLWRRKQTTNKQLQVLQSQGKSIPLAIWQEMSKERLCPDWVLLPRCTLWSVLFTLDSSGRCISLYVNLSSMCIFFF
jgi:hypothetical protein